MWFDIFKACHRDGLNGVERIDWPDGGNYFDQENLTVSFFEIVVDELRSMRESG